ncbi:YceI family protein [Oceanihabitans sediminis]|uniref:YceI family protein n=1 Tax=Oceanihabitans sediminis TaxID=1812012 RepID=UPI000931825D|nr:YceI family protein [Oceanihabitans sediminis]MDX1278928.1 YceI family protein [Oceanihabitans sediminis]MDX1772477.1 YceI family protein [Oceanihabitans sediminis]RBP34128.1 polyisoprenoid-binding protein YceI [Oceanihabitans sediminis]
MKKILYILTILLLTNITSAYAQQTINQQKSIVNFHISGGVFFKVKGTFTGMQGDFNFDSKAIENANFQICIDAETINTSNNKRDNHLRSPDFFETETYPKICFQSKQVVKSASGYTTIGNLSIHGVTKEVEIPFTFENNIFTGNLTINRFDYDIGLDFGTFRVGREASVTITCVIE